MSESYVECLVQKKPSAAGRFLYVFLIVLAVLFFVVMFVFPFAIFLVLIAGAAAYFVHLHTDIEYEYLYLDREITVDRILAKSKRKRVATYEVDRMEILAPFHSYHLEDFKNRNVKTIDYSIGEELKPDERYTLYYEGGTRLILSPTPEFVKAVKNVAPRKVFTD